jgi:hypothetical protein
VLLLLLPRTNITGFEVLIGPIVIFATALELSTTNTGLPDASCIWKALVEVVLNNAEPATCKSAEGALVPMPTLPEAVICSLSVRVSVAELEAGLSAVPIHPQLPLFILHCIETLPVIVELELATLLALVFETVCTPTVVPLFVVAVIKGVVWSTL